MDHEYEESLFSRIEGEIPDIDLASLEYFAGIPFDDRLEHLLDNESPTVSISMEGTTDQLLDDPLFPPNETNLVEVTLSEDEVVVIDAGRYRYNLAGSSTYDGKHLSVDLNVHDGDSNSVGVIFKDVPDHNYMFVAYRIDPDRDPVSKIINTKELTRYLCLLANIEPHAAEKALRHIDKVAQNPSTLTLDRTIYQDYFMQLWNRFGQEDESATRSETRTLIHPLTDDTADEQEVVRLQQTEQETARENLLTTTFEYAKIYQTLDIEDTYTLTLVFTKDGKENLDQSASRIVSSGADAYRLKKAKAAQVINGRETPLDLNDPAVQGLFVDWFDQLVSA